MTQLISWVEIPTTNFERAVEFYKSVLKIDLQSLDFGEEKMACFPNGEGAISIFRPVRPVGRFRSFCNTPPFQDPVPQQPCQESPFVHPRSALQILLRAGSSPQAVLCSLPR